MVPGSQRIQAPLALTCGELAPSTRAPDINATASAPAASNFCKSPKVIGDAQNDKRTPETCDLVESTWQYLRPCRSRMSPGRIALCKTHGGVLERASARYSPAFRAIDLPMPDQSMSSPSVAIVCSRW